MYQSENNLTPVSQSQAPMFSGSELVMLFTAMSVSILTAYLLLSDFSLVAKDTSSKGEAIARIEKLDNDVKRRSASYPVWEKISGNESLYNKDQIYTDAKSIAEVRFENGDILELEENALVVIEKRGTSTTIDIKRGSVYATVSSKSKSNLSLKSGKLKANLINTGSRVLIQKKEDSQASVSVLSGNADVQMGAQQLSVEKNEKIFESKGAIKRITVLPLSVILPTKRRLVFDRERDLKFQWEKISSIKSLKVEFSKSESFSRVSMAVPASATEMTIKSTSFKGGRYFWRLAAKVDGDGLVYSLPQKVDIRRVSSPELVWPSSGNKFEATPSPKGQVFTTYFDWTSDEFLDEFQVELAADGKFKKVLWKKTVTQIPVNTPRMRPGHYYWRVKGFNGKSFSTEWSDVFDFEVAAKKQVVVPEVPVEVEKPDEPLPVEEPEITEPIKKSGPLELLQPVKVAEPIEVASESMPIMPEPAPIVQEPSPIPNIEPTPPKLAMRKVPEIEELLVAPKVLNPRNKSNLNFDEDEPHIARLMWSSTGKAERFAVAVARDKKFSKGLQRFSSTSTHVKVPVIDEGKYFWYVESQKKAKSGKLLASRSEVQTFQVETTTLPVYREYDNSLRIEVGYIPSYLDYTHRETGGKEFNLRTQFYQSFYAAIRGWVTDNWGVDAEFSGKYRKEQFEVVEESVFEHNLQLTFMDAQLAAKRRFRLLPRVFPIDFALRFGYYYNQVLNFSTLNEGEEASQVSEISNVHNALIGIESGVPLGSDFSLEGKFDYLYLVASSPATFPSSTHYAANLSFLYQFMRSGIMTYGFFYRAERYKFVSSSFDSSGEVELDFYGLMYALGWVF